MLHLGRWVQYSEASCVSSATHVHMSPHAAHTPYRILYRTHWWCVRLVSDIFGSNAKTNMGGATLHNAEMKTHEWTHKFSPAPSLTRAPFAVLPLNTLRSVKPNPKRLTPAKVIATNILEENGQRTGLGINPYPAKVENKVSS